MRTFTVEVPDSDGQRVDAYAQARGLSKDAAAADLLQIAIKEHADIAAKIRDVERARDRRRERGEQ